MKKVIRFTGLACPNCTKKLEEAMAGTPGLISFGANFITGKLTVEAEDSAFPAILEAITEKGRAIKPEFALKD
jgi:copper chaperone CopZ